MLNKHSCSTVIINCIDFRLQENLNQLTDKLELKGDYDLISIGGSAKAIVSPKNNRDQEFLLEQINISTSLHHVQRIIIIHHQDCGAYGGSKAFSSQEEEKTKHISDMQEASNLIKNIYPDLKVELFYANMKEKAWDFEKI